MNTHLNIFRTYAKDNRSYQLENDLTRALAICLQEDALFSHEVLKSIFGQSNLYNQLFEDIDCENNIQVEIQKKTSDMGEFNNIFAVSLSESSLTNFWQQTHNSEYDPICDLVITINDVLIVIEAKRDNINCTTQLYNQILNIFKKKNKSIDEHKEIVTPFDMNWKKLMAIAVKVASFERSTGNSNRFLSDFIQLVKDHNFSWLPETPIGSLNSNNSQAIFRRIESALIQSCKHSSLEKLPFSDRLGFIFTPGWANEVLFDIDQGSGDLVVDIYPGNTKEQGYHIFHKEPQFSNALNIDGDVYSIDKRYHIKFMGQSYITSLSLVDNDFKKTLYTKDNFNEFSGRWKKDSWGSIETLLNEHISVDWKNQCKWQTVILDSNRTQFAMSFGYEVSIRIPFNKLAQLDKTHDDIKLLADLIESIYKSLETDLITEGAST